jgi:hypothetical protein
MNVTLENEYAADWVMNENARFMVHSRQALLDENAQLKAKVESQEERIRALEHQLSITRRIRAFALQGRERG